MRTWVMLDWVVGETLSEVTFELRKEVANSASAKALRLKQIKWDSDASDLETEA